MSKEAEQHRRNGKLYVPIWTTLVLLTLLEVWLAYAQPLSTLGMMVVLVAATLIKAALIVAYFMHLRFESFTFVWSLVPSVVLVIALLAMFFPDSFRSAELRTK